MTLTPLTMTVPELYQEQLLHLVPAEVVRYDQIISGRLYVPFKGTFSLAGRALLNTCE